MAISVLRMLDRLCGYDRQLNSGCVCCDCCRSLFFVCLFLFWFVAIHHWSYYFVKMIMKSVVLITHFASHHFRRSRYDCDVQNTFFVETLSQFSVYLTNRQVVDFVCNLRDWYFRFEFWTILLLSDIFSKPGELHPKVRSQRCYFESKFEKIEGTFCPWLSVIVLKFSMMIKWSFFSWNKL